MLRSSAGGDALAVDLVNAGQRRVAFLLAQQPRKFVFENDVERLRAVVADEMAGDRHLFGLGGHLRQQSGEILGDCDRHADGAALGGGDRGLVQHAVTQEDTDFGAFAALGQLAGQATRRRLGLGP